MFEGFVGVLSEIAVFVSDWSDYEASWFVIAGHFLKDPLCAGRAGGL